MSDLKLAPPSGPRVCADQPCPACPFRRTAMRGYVGGYGSVGSFYDTHVHGEAVNPCHTTLDYDDPDWKAKFAAGHMGRRCRGQAVFFANMLKFPKNPDIQRLPQDREAVFAWPAEFFAHHGAEHGPTARAETAVRRLEAQMTTDRLRALDAPLADTFRASVYLDVRRNWSASFPSTPDGFGLALKRTRAMVAKLGGSVEVLATVWPDLGSAAGTGASVGGGVIVSVQWGV